MQTSMVGTPWKAGLSAQSGSLSITPFTGASVGTNTYDATSLANALVGAGVTVSNATLKGARQAAGIFAGGQPSVGFPTGVVLSTGLANSLIGPNNVVVSDGQAADVLNMAGDNDLFQLAKTAATATATPQPTQAKDASILEFDFVPQGDLVYFNYVFASEEYNDWIGTQFNDAFGFFINGRNCALIPNPQNSALPKVPVTVNTVNLTKNTALFRNNTVAGPLQNETQADGLTTILTCAVTANPGVTNHAKLAIADSSDAFVNSWVMIQAGSFSTTNANAPVLTLPADQVIEVTVTSPSMSVPYTVTASDVQDGNLTSKVVCTPPSPVTVNVDQTVTVNCAVSDSGGLKAQGSFKIKVVDTTPPVLILPASQILNATSPSGSMATYTATATDLGQNVPVQCTPASGSVFALGVTTVSCSATDTHNLTSTGTFTVTVGFQSLGGFFKDGQNDNKKAGSTWPMKVLPPTYASGQVASTLASGLTLTLNGQATPSTWTWNGQFYQANLKTTGMAAGSYQVNVSYQGVVIASDVLTLR
ncbi:choice-of-anchor L domain-containing protein [Deinococcus alpinitundrae]|uniref:choice-of-anchor L domain-containing protein n=1 Tax=Deinococcus alpinitundrae TaxID=468913 RepID=UPI001ED9154D|nr:choice-of-anchor L domain-containing protein [Deinococcus alpinitundrae]